MLSCDATYMLFEFSHILLFIYYGRAKRGYQHILQFFVVARKATITFSSCLFMLFKYLFILVHILWGGYHVERWACGHEKLGV
jgi:hypothetical protein